MKNKLILTLFMLGVFVSALDNGIIASALSAIGYSFQTTQVQTTWGVTLYTLGMAVSTPIMGKMADQFGRKKIFLLEMLLFMVGSGLVASSPNFTFFLVARFVQSIGGGGLFVIASSYILDNYSREQSSKLLGVVGALNGIASVVGPNLGSLILSATNQWHWLFSINIPIILFILILGAKIIPESQRKINSHLDLKGLIFLTMGVFGLMSATTLIRSGALLESITSIPFIVIIVFSIVSFTLFVHAETAISPDKTPFLPAELIKNSRFMLILLLGTLSGTLIALFVFIPSFVEQRFGVPANQSGIWMSGIGLGSILGAGIGGQLVAKLGATKSIIISGFISLLGFTTIALMNQQPWLFILASTIAGLGFGMLMGAPFTVLVSDAVNPMYKGVALGTLSVSRQLGLTLAPSIYATAVSAGFNTLHLNKPVENVYQSLLAMPQSVEKKELLSKFYEVAQGAYQNMFMLAMAVSILILLGGLLLNVKFTRIKQS